MKPRKSIRYSITHSTKVWSDVFIETEEMLDLFSELLARADCFYDIRYMGFGALNCETGIKIRDRVNRSKKEIIKCIEKIKQKEKSANLRITTVDHTVYNR